jgi:hypothetical protein
MAVIKVGPRDGCACRLWGNIMIRCTHIRSHSLSASPGLGLMCGACGYWKNV